MGWIVDEAFWLFGPTFIDVFKDGEAFEGLQSFSEVIGFDESLKMLTQLFMR